MGKIKKQRKRMSLQKRLVLSFLKLIFMLLIIFLVLWQTPLSTKETFVADKGNLNFANLVDYTVQKDLLKDKSILEGNFKSLSVYSKKNNTLYYFTKSNDQLIPASLTKLFTVSYIVDNFDIHKSVKVGDEIRFVDPLESIVGFQPGQVVSINDLLAGALLPSGGDSIYILGSLILAKNNIDSSNFTKQQFVENVDKILNEYVKSIGLENTNITNPTGISETTTTTTLDMMKITQKLAQNYNVINLSSKYKMKVGEYILRNTNSFVDPDSPYYTKAVIGLKTGTLEDYCNLDVVYDKSKNAKISIEGQENNDEEDLYYITVFGAATKETRNIKIKQAIDYINKYLD